jgi:hypothetical protein
MPLHLPFHHSKEDKPQPPQERSGAETTEGAVHPHRHGGCLAGISKSAHHAVDVAHHAVDVAVHAVDVAAHNVTKHDEVPPTFWVSECGGGSGPIPGV